MTHFTAVADGLFYNHDTGAPYSNRVLGKPRVVPFPGSRMRQLTASNRGYYLVWVDGAIRRWHRLVWEHFNGPIPKGLEIDHINNDRSDCRLENLRLTTAKHNTRCAKVNRRNTSGFPGVSWHKASQSWAAKIRVDNHAHHLGLFDDPAQGYRAYYAAKVLFHGVESVRALPRPEVVNPG